MRYVLGIDSGGTKYLVRAARLDGTLLGMFTGPTCNHYYLSRMQTLERIAQNIDACLAEFGGKREDCAYLMCGTTGYDSQEDGEIIQSIYHSLPGFNCPIRCINDAELAHYTATGGEGVLLIAGTGSIAFGRNSAGKTIRVGGWFSSIMGDEGSGRYVDAWALHHYSRWLDGCRPRTLLVEKISAELKIKTRKALMDYSAQMATPPWPSPKLGRIVNEAAEQEDEYARKILKRAGSWNFRLADEAIRALAFDQEASFVVGVWGSTIIEGKFQRKEMARLLAAAYPQARLCVPEHDAAEGAIQLALSAVS